MVSFRLNSIIHQLAGLATSHHGTEQTFRGSESVAVVDVKIAEEDTDNDSYKDSDEHRAEESDKDSNVKNVFQGKAARHNLTISSLPLTMSSSNREGHLSPSSTITAINNIPESPHDRKQSTDIIVDWDGPQDPDNPKKLVYLKLFSEAGTEPTLSIQLAIPTQMGSHLCCLLVHLYHPSLLRHSRACNLPSRFRIGRQKQRRHRHDDVDLHLGIRSVVSYFLRMRDFAPLTRNRRYIACGPLVSSPEIGIFLSSCLFKSKVLGPLSEIFGRSRVLQLSNLFYLSTSCNHLSSSRMVRLYAVWNLACGFATSPGQYIAFRLLAGLGGSGPISVRYNFKFRPILIYLNLAMHTNRSEAAC